MSERTTCDRCLYYAHSPYMVCAVHPKGPKNNPCDDFREASKTEEQGESDPLGWFSDDWQPALPPGRYLGEVIEQPVTHQTLVERLEMLNWHPLFTGRCPNCEMPIQATQPPRVHWDCAACGWVDDTV